MLPIPFDNPATYEGHSGVDYGQPRGTPFYASGPGTVTWLGFNPRGGNFIWVKYDGYPAVGYHHMDSHSGCPPVGARVGEGSLLGYVGSTGNSTGPHLHSEVEGHATTGGYWRFFTPDQIVGEEMNDFDRQQIQALGEKLNKALERLDNINAWISEGGPGVTKAMAKPGTVAARVINLDRQVTGTDNFEKQVGPTVASRLVELQKKLEK